ncbi:hypothetical protein D3C76_649890 [compost metagenome]
MIESRVLAAQEAGRRMQSEQSLRIELANHFVVSHPNLSVEETAKLIEQAVVKRRQVLQRLGVSA